MMLLDLCWLNQDTVSTSALNQALNLRAQFGPSVRREQ